MPLGIRERVPFPTTYKGFRLLRTHGLVFGFPAFLEAESVGDCLRLLAHPAALSAPSLRELQALIDGHDAVRDGPEVVAAYQGYDLVRQRGRCYGVPQSAGPVDLDLEAERRRAGVIGGAGFEEVRQRIRGAREAVPVEFAGWLPVFKSSGDCGAHPQFTHTASPPPGYCFTQSVPPPGDGRAARRVGLVRRCAVALARLRAGLSRLSHAVVRAARPLLAPLRPGPAGLRPRARLRLLAAVARLFVVLLRRGARVGPALRFLQSRHFQSQMLLADQRGLVFLTSMPYTYGQNPWVVEIEDPTTLFYPFVHNGLTSDLRLAESPYFPVVKALLESESCKGVLTHMRSTAAMLPTLFRSEAIAKKVFHVPLGVLVPARWQRHDGPDESEHLDLLFINSWHQIPGNFCLRGGLDVLEAFAILRERYPQLRLTLRSSLPGLADHYYRLMEAGWVRVINRFLPAEELAALHADSHIFLLPAARIHVVSLLQAMSYGLAVVASDGWGIEEYLDHERNGLVVKGRYGKASWVDEEAGMLREDYEPLHTPDPDVVQGLVEAISRLVEDAELRRRLGRAARRDVETKYSLECWNRGLKEALDRALNVKGTAETRQVVVAAAKRLMVRRTNGTRAQSTFRWSAIR
jgi:glycosyltransferase involved in cell wall biosynthesis